MEVTKRSSRARDVGRALPAPLSDAEAARAGPWRMLALIIFYLFYKTRLQDRILQAGLLLAIGIGMYIHYSKGVFASLVRYLIRGSVETTTSLTGRIPL
jgi:hypothetical protein